MGNQIDPNNLESLSFAVVEDDLAIQELIRENLKHLGVTSVDTFDNGDEAWYALGKKSYDFVILDWKLMGMGGLTIFNRLRQSNRYWKVPVLGISGFVTQKDFRLLEEFPFSKLLEKPFSGDNFRNSIQLLKQETHWYHESKSLINETVKSFYKTKKGSLTEIIDLIHRSPNPLPIAITFSRSLIYQGRILEAEKVLTTILQDAPDSLILKTELGKVYLEQGQFEKANEILSKARDQSPENVGRLCLIGQTELNLNDYDAARRSFEQALEIDPDSQEALVGCSILRDIHNFESEQYVQHAPQNFASIMNNIGVSLVRTGRIKEGIEHYHQAWKFVFGTDAKIKISLNLGLGYMRHDIPDQAYQWFKKSVELSQGKFLKALRYLQLVGQHQDLSENLKVQAGEITAPHLSDAVQQDPLSHESLVDALYSDDIFLPAPDSSLSSQTQDVINLLKDKVPENMDELIQQVPEVESIFEKLSARGQLVGPHCEKFIQFVKEYGASQFTAATRVALARDTPTAMGIEQILRQFREMSDHLDGPKRSG